MPYVQFSEINNETTCTYSVQIQNTESYEISLLLYVLDIVMKVPSIEK